MTIEIGFRHRSVMVNEVLEYLRPQAGGIFIDATINGGGHAAEISNLLGSNGRLLGIDRDPEILKKLSSKYVLVCDSFANIKQIAVEHKFTEVNGILFDLGFSSFHIEKSERGFSFLRDEPLDMRYNAMDGISASDIINTWHADDISNLLYILGEERYARRIAWQIIEERHKSPIVTTKALVEVIRKAVPPIYKKRRIHFATRTFQALRMRVNDELEHVARGVEEAITLLIPNGRIAVLSFHSGEDRIVKRIFQRLEKEKIIRRVLKKPVRATHDECKNNPRARSAKLRIVERI